MKVPRFKMAPARGSKVRTIEIIIIHRNIFKNFLLQSHLAQRLRFLKFRMKHCLVILYQVCSIEGPQVQDGPEPGGPRFEP